MIITMTQHFTAICSEVVGLFYTGMMDLWQFAIRTPSEYKALASMTDPVFLRNDCKGWFVSLNNHVSCPTSAHRICSRKHFATFSQRAVKI